MRKKPSLRSDEEAHALAMQNLGLIGFTLRKIRGIEPNDIDDAFQQAYIALFGAARIYDMARGQFSTFGIMAIRHKMFRWANSKSVIYVPPHAYGHPKYRKHARRARLVSGSLGLEEVPEQEDVEAEEWDDRRHRLSQALWRLDERKREIIRGRLNGEHLHTIGSRLGISKERVRQLQNQAVKELREICGKTACSLAKTA